MMVRTNTKMQYFFLETAQQDWGIMFLTKIPFFPSRRRDSFPAQFNSSHS